MWKKIEQLVEAKGLNWAKLARSIGESDSRISKWRSGTGEPDRNQLLRISRFLETGMEYLADDSLEEPQSPQQLAEDERAVLQIYRALRPQLDQIKAIRALSAASNAELSISQRSTIQGQPHDPETGEPIEVSDPRTTKRRRQA